MGLCSRHVCSVGFIARLAPDTLDPALTAAHSMTQHHEPRAGTRRRQCGTTGERPLIGCVPVGPGWRGSAPSKTRYHTCCLLQLRSQATPATFATFLTLAEEDTAQMKRGFCADSTTRQRGLLTPVCVCACVRVCDTCQAPSWESLTMQPGVAGQRKMWPTQAWWSWRCATLPSPWAPRRCGHLPCVCNCIRREIAPVGHM